MNIKPFLLFFVVVIIFLLNDITVHCYTDGNGPSVWEMFSMQERRGDNFWSNVLGA